MASIQGTTTTYHLRDQLSVRANTDGTSGSSTFGQTIGQQGHYPYGEGWYSSGTTTKWQFTSYERDTESGMDYATARFYINRFGRFYSPDPISGSQANPQTLNLFTYVVDDPIDYADPDGTLPIAIDGGCHGDPGGTPPFFPGGGFPWPVWWPGGAGGGESRPRFPLFLIVGLIRASEGGGGRALAICDCYLAPTNFPSIQGIGCDYICTCPDGLSLALLPPNPYLSCFLKPCPFYAVVAFHFGAAVDWGDVLRAYPPVCKDKEIET